MDSLSREQRSSIESLGPPPCRMSVSSLDTVTFFDVPAESRNEEKGKKMNQWVIYRYAGMSWLLL